MPGSSTKQKAGRGNKSSDEQQQQQQQQEDLALHIWLWFLVRDYFVESLAQDPAMMLMGMGAACKFVELVILRNDFSAPRFLFSILGGILIAAGSGLVTYSTIQSMIDEKKKKQSREKEKKKK